MKKKWYLQTWFIALLFFIAFFFIVMVPIAGLIILVVGIALIIIQAKDNKRLLSAYGTYDEIVAKTNKLEEDFSNKQIELEKDFSDKQEQLDDEYHEKESSLENQYKANWNKLSLKETEYTQQIDLLKQEISNLSQESDQLTAAVLVDHYNFAEYDGLFSEDCKSKLVILKNEEQELIKSGNAFDISFSSSRKATNDNKKQILRCFQAECTNLLLNLSVKNIDSVRSKIAKSFESLNKIFEIDGVVLNSKLLEIKLEELNLTYTFQLKQQQEKERQKAIKEQMVEEEKVRREIERQKAKIDKDCNQFNNEVKKLMAYMQKTSSDVEKQLYIDKIK